jgi:undecaprenyl-diphosphatase
MPVLTYPEAMVIGLLQGVTELFPVSSLGHSVLIPAIIGGSWAKDLNVSASESPYLAYIVGLHVATAAALICYFWKDWVRIVGGLLTSVRYWRVTTANERLAWMIILATIPVGIAGLALEHLFRVFFSKPVPTALFLCVNGLILLWSERRRKARAVAADGAAVPGRPGHGQHPQYQQAPHQQAPHQQAPHQQAPHQQAPRRPDQWQSQPQQQQWNRDWDPQDRDPQDQWPPQGRPAQGQWPAQPPQYREAGAGAGQAEHAGHADHAVAADRRLSAMSLRRAVMIGAAQIAALLPGISRDGIVTVVSMRTGLRREDAVRYSFLLSTPVILAAGVLKIPDLFGPLGAGIHGQVIVGSVLSFIGAYVSVRFLTKYFSESKSLRPFGIYCLVAGLFSLFFILAFR